MLLLFFQYIFLMDLMSNMNQGKHLLSFSLILIRRFFYFFNLSGDSMYKFPDNGL